MLSTTITELEDGLSVVLFEGDDGFAEFLESGGASSDGEVANYLTGHLLANVGFSGNPFGCSTLAVSSPEGHRLFGRNFDWYNCDALVVVSRPESGYASISTVNLNFITQAGGPIGAAMKQDQIKTLAALYAPLDGMNEAGLAVSVNMIEDRTVISQNSDKPDITTTTAIRYLLNQAATVEEAITLLGQADLHSSMGMMIHFFVADKTGRSATIEYVNNEMTVTDTPILTNYYLAEGEKQGVGTSQSHERFEILSKALENRESMSFTEVRDTLESVSKHHYHDGETTEWSVIFDLDEGVARYYHRENYGQEYVVALPGREEP